MNKKEEYNASKIQVLEGLEAVKKRPGMYIGSTNIDGLHHLLWEILDNSIDEVLAGFANKIKIVLEKNNSVTVIDDGRGIPIDIQKNTKLSAVETIFTVLHSGGKFNKDGYKVSGGLHGVGASVVNALSSELKVKVYRNNKIYYQKFENGFSKNKLKIIGNTNKKGTLINFKANKKIFKETIKFDFLKISTRLKELAYLNKKLILEINDVREEEKKEKKFYYTGGIESYINDINKKKKKVLDKPIFLYINFKNIKIEIVFQYIEDYKFKILSFVNNIRTKEGGTHEIGFKSALTRTINEYIKKQQKKFEKENLIGEDIREGLVVIISIKHPDPQFEGQTKTKLGNTEVRTIIENIFSKQFLKFLLENPIISKKIINKIFLSFNARLAAKKAREIIRRKNILEISKLPGKLSDCSNKNPEKCELFIVEGDSAGGSAKQGRNREFQAILPIRGKILNVEKSNIQKILSNNEINNLIQAIGTGFKENFDLTKLRYNKIIIMTDADVDGAHIRILLLTFFYKFMFPLLKKGFIYIANPPLYGIKIGKKIKYINSGKNSELNLKEEIKKISKKNFIIQRYKGLGEMDSEQLWDTTMNPENRILSKIELNDLKLIEKMFKVLMGNCVMLRKNFIQKYSYYVKNLDV